MYYLVVWSINVEADSHEHAAKLAMDIQKDPNSIALFFDVKAIDETLFTTVDLLPSDEEMKRWKADRLNHGM